MITSHRFLVLTNISGKTLISHGSVVQDDNQRRYNLLCRYESRYSYPPNCIKLSYSFCQQYIGDKLFIFHGSLFST